MPPGGKAIGQFLGMSIRKVLYACEARALPIRYKKGVGVYAFKSELLAALKNPGTLPPNTAG